MRLFSCTVFPQRQRVPTRYWLRYAARPANATPAVVRLDVPELDKEIVRASLQTFYKRTGATLDEFRTRCGEEAYVDVKFQWEMHALDRDHAKETALQHLPPAERKKLTVPAQKELRRAYLTQTKIVTPSTRFIDLICAAIKAQPAATHYRVELVTDATADHDWFAYYLPVLLRELTARLVADKAPGRDADACFFMTLGRASYEGVPTPLEFDMWRGTAAEGAALPETDRQAMVVEEEEAPQAPPPPLLSLEDARTAVSGAGHILSVIEDVDDNAPTSSQDLGHAVAAPIESETLVESQSAGAKERVRSMASDATMDDE